MRTKIVSRTALDILSVEDVKQHCRVDDDYDLDLLQAYTLAATDIAEKQTNRMLMPAVVDLFSSTYEAKFFLPYGEVSRIVEVKAKNLAEEEEVITDFTYNAIDESVTVNPKLFIRYTDFVVRYECGYQDGLVPNAIKQGMLIAIGTLYNVREDVSYGVQAFQTPITANRLFNLYRIHSGG